MVHLHPDQEETFTVQQGQLEVLRDGGWQPVRAGESHTVPRGAVHAWRNGGPAPACFLNVHRPALGFEAHMRTLHRLAGEGKIRSTRDVRSVIYMCMSAAEHQPDVTIRPPQWVVQGMARLGRLLGFKLASDATGR